MFERGAISQSVSQSGCDMSRIPNGPAKVGSQ